jgi:hypothetical protein
LHIDEGHVRTQEERAFGIGGVDGLGDSLAQLARESHLVRGALGLEILVEEGDDVPVDVIRPQAGRGSQAGVAGQQGATDPLRPLVGEVFEVFHQHRALVATPVAVA